MEFIQYMWVDFQKIMSFRPEGYLYISNPNPTNIKSNGIIAHQIILKTSEK